MTTAADARLRYQCDAEFHAKVLRAVNLASVELQARSGEPLTEDERVPAILSAAVALHLAEGSPRPRSSVPIPPSTWPIDTRTFAPADERPDDDVRWKNAPT